MAEKECSSASCSKESCEGCPSAKKEQKGFAVDMNVYSDVKHVILSLIHISEPTRRS